MVIAMCGHPMLSVKGALDRCLSQGAQSAVHPDRDLLFRLCYPPVIFGRFSDLSWVFSGLSFCHPLYSDLQVVECTPVETHLFPACFRLLFSRFFRFFADISKAATRFSCYLQRFASAVGLHANSERIIAVEGIPYSADMKKTFRRLDKRPTADLGCAVQPATGLQNSWHTR